MKKLLFLILLLALSSCSIFQSSQSNEEVNNDDENVDEVYVFDEVSEDEVDPEEIKELEKELNKPVVKTTEDKNVQVDVFDEPIKKEVETQNSNSQSFFLQLGAFTTLNRAEQYVKEIEKDVPFKLSILYNSNTSYYTVKSSPFSTKLEAETVRDNFWNKNLFKDAFIVTE